MSLASLKDELRTGIAELDDEHRELIEVMEELCDCFDRTPVTGAVTDVFGILYARVLAHFALEERIMREKKYAGYKAHKRDHDRLLEQIHRMMEAYEEGRCAECGTDLRACLETWLADHVRTSDTALCVLAE